MAARQLRWVAMALFGALAWVVWPVWNVGAQGLHHISLPVVYQGHRAQGAITGRLLYHGQPEAGAAIQLLRYAVASPGVVIGAFTATTSISGTFSFDTPMALQANERYYLSYDNPTLYGPPNQYDTTRVLSWTSYDMTSYAYNEVAAFPDIDVGSVSLNINPDVVQIPYQFGWGRRGSYPTESYGMLLTDQVAAMFGSGPLGYADHYDLNTLPPGFAYDVPCIWGVHIVSPTAGEGYSFFLSVMFGTAGQPGSLAPVAAPAAILQR